jgi:hypothetical protein
MDNNEWVTLYTSFKDDSRGWLTLHRQHFTQFVAIILAVLGATAVAYIKLSCEGKTFQIIALGPALCIPLSVLAILACNKFYKRYAEHDAISFKLFHLLESREDIKKDLDSVKHIFPKNDYLFPKRWVKRLNDAETIDKYAKSRVFAPDASNFYIMLTFTALIIVSGILAIFIVS